jgi:hypothetical protein
LTKLDGTVYADIVTKVYCLINPHEGALMDIISLVIILGVVVASDEILNNQLKVSKRLLDWLDKQ